MIISFTVFNSFFTYIQSVYNHHKGKSWLTPFSFIFFIFSEWFFFDLGVINFGVSYFWMEFIFLLLYGVTIFAFFIFYSLNWKAFIEYKRMFLQEFPFLCLLLFIAIFFIFYKRGYFAEQSDMWFYYQMMNSLHVAGQNAFSHQLINNYSQYLTTGIYQLGSSLSLTQRLFLFPYFTTYFYFFVVTTSTHEILNRYIKTSWKQWTILVLICLIFLFVYWFLNWQSYVILVGNIESAFLLLLILIPSFIHFDQSNTKLFILFLFLGYLFYDETCILVNIVYTFSFLLFILIFRKKYRISISYFLTSCSIFILCSYLILYFGFTLTTNLLIEYAKPIFIVLVFLVYLEIVILSLYTFDCYFKFKFIRSSKCYYLINKVWTYDYMITPLRSKLKNNSKSNLIVKILLFAILSLILVFAVYDFEYESTSYWKIIAIQFFTFACFIFITYFIVFKKVRSAFTYYFFILMFFAFAFDCTGFIFKNPSLSWIIERLTYIGLNPTYVEEGSIKNVVLLMYFCLLVFEEKNWQFRIMYKCRKMFSSTLLNADVFAIASSLVLISIIPATNAALDGIYYLNVVNAQDSNLLGISSQTWNKLAKINFDDKLTFCDFYLPMANTTITYNIQHVLYPAYGDLKDFYNYKLNLYDPFYTINGKRIEEYNSQTFANEILPYYNYVVIKDNDKFIENILKKDPTFTLWNNINNNVFIFKNINLNVLSQEEFLKYNPIVFSNNN